MTITPLDPQDISPAAAAMLASPDDQRSAWRDLWATGRTFWDLGDAHPLLPSLLSRARELRDFQAGGARIFVPGCGQGHEAAYLARSGAQTDAADYSPEAVSLATRRYGAVPNLRFNVEDVFGMPASAAGRYDAVVDRAMLCAIQPAQRSPYLRACAHRLRPGGLFFSIAFAAVVLEGGPPFPISPADLTDLAGTQFHPAYFSRVPATTMTEYIRDELLVLLVKVGP
jgi:methyl halide transferase